MYSSVESTASMELSDRSLEKQTSTFQPKCHGKEEGKSPYHSSTHSSLVIANLHTLKDNLKDMMSNLSEMTNFLDSEEVTVKKTAVCIPHPSDVCDASKSDEMKLNEILVLLHHLTRTLTAYETNPVLANFPCKDYDVEDKQAEPREASSDSNNSAQTINIKDNKSLRNEIYGIIQRKEALEERMESFRKNATASGEYEFETGKKRSKSSGSSCASIIHNHVGLDDLKMEDELLGLRDGGLSGEINSLGETIQHLLDENKNFRSFFKTIATNDQFGLRNNNNSKNRPTCAPNLCIPIGSEFMDQSIKCTELDLNHVPSINSTRSNHQLSGSDKYQSNSRNFQIINKDTVPKSTYRSRPPLSNLLTDNSNDQILAPLNMSQLSYRDRLSLTANNCDSRYTSDRNTMETSQLTDQARLNVCAANDVNDAPQSRNMSEGDPPYQPSYTEPDASPKLALECNKFEAVNWSQQNLSSNLGQLYEVEGMVNFLMKEALTVKELLRAENFILHENDYNQGKNSEQEFRRLSKAVHKLRDLSEEVYSNILRSFHKKDAPCHSKSCHYQKHGLKRQNRLLQKQLSLQASFNVLISESSSKTHESLPMSQEDSSCIHVKSTPIEDCQVQKKQSIEISKTSDPSSVDGATHKSFIESSQQSTISPDESPKKYSNMQDDQSLTEHKNVINETTPIIKLQKLLVEERLRGQLWCAAENAASMRLADVEECLRKVKHSKRELQAKYKTLRQSHTKKSLIENPWTTKSQKSNEIMLATLGNNIGIATEILSSHLYFPKCVIHPSPELTEDPTFWFASQCSKLRWLQGQLRRLCLDKWKNNGHATEVDCGESESTDGTDTLTSQCGGSRVDAQPIAQDNRYGEEAAPERRLSLPECGFTSSRNLFPYASWS